MRSTIINVVWYATFHVLAFCAGWAIASTNQGEEMVPVGIAIAIVGGPLLAQLSKLARRLDRDPYVVRVQLDRFRYVWIWSTIWLGGGIIAGWALADQIFYTYFIQRSILAMAIAGMAVAGWFARIAGRKREYLRVDVAAGVVEHVGAGKPLACPVDQIDRFEVVKYRRPRVGRGHNPDWFRLVAPGFPDRVFADSVYPGGVEKLRAELQQRLDDLRDISAIRRVLADTPTEGSTYRAGLSLDDAVRAAVEDPARRRAALAALADDFDREIQQRAAAMAST